MSSLLNVLYIQTMKAVYVARDALPQDLVCFCKDLHVRIKTWKSAVRIRLAGCVPDSVRGFWYRREWWKAIWLKKIFPEEWLYERDYLRRYKKWEKRLWRRLVEANVVLGRSLTNEESEKLRKYEQQYTSIRLWFMDSHATIIGLCFGYTFFVEDSRKDDGHICRVLYRDGEFDSNYISPNTYLSDKFYKTFDSITKESFAFWYEYLMRNRDKITIESIEWHLKREYAEAGEYFRTGKAITHNAEISFSTEEEQEGRKAMQQMGIKEPYVCIFARDAQYNVKMRHVSTLERDSQDLRNSDINSFKAMTQYFWSKGIQSVRMGAAVAAKYECEGAIDYANCGRTEFLDAYIFSRCRFFIGDVSGIQGLAYLSGKLWGGINLPQVMEFGDQPQPMAIGIYLKYYDRERKCYLRLREMIDLEIEYRMSLSAMGDEGYFSYMLKNYDVIRNTPREIEDVAREMEAIQNQLVHYTEHDEQLQLRYRDLIKKSSSMFPTIQGGDPGRIGMQWLRENEWFLE